MGLISKLKTLPRKLVVASFVGVASLATGLGLYANAGATNIVLNDGSECVKQSVVWCGSQDLATLQNKYKNGDGHNSVASIHNIYGYSKFGIDATDIANMSKYAVAGYVTSDGKVYVGNELVADNAFTASRGTTSDSTKVTYNGTTFYIRHTRVSWYKATTKAYVVMINGKFQFAIMGPCGNPVMGTPKTPNYTIQKDVRVKGTSTWSDSVSVKSGTHVEYRVTVKSTGQVSAKNIKVNDVLPANVEFVSGTLKRDGSSASSSAFFGSGDTITSLAAGKSVTYTFEAIVAPKDTVYTCETASYTNTAKMSSAGLPPKSDTADVNKTCAAKPDYSCVNLSKTDVSRNTFNFTTTAAASGGAKIKSYVYDFGDGKTATNNSSDLQNSVQHQYAEAGNYTVKVTVVPDTTTTKTSTKSECTLQVSVEKAPTAACENLKLTLGTDRTVTAEVTYHADQGVTLKNIAYNFGDDSAVVNSTDTTATHQYSEDGNYTVTATLSFDAAESVANQECQASVGINTPAYSCDAFDVTKGDNRSVTVSKFSTSQSGGATYKEVRIDWGDGVVSEPAVKAIGQTHSYTKDGTYTIVATAYFTVEGQTVSAPAGHCEAKVSFNTPTPPVTPPQVLPNTGAGDVIGFFSATTIAGGLLHRFFLRRRVVA